MATIIFILILLSGYHFIYESILIPSTRLNIRYQLFKLRDELRRLKIEKDKEISDEVFHYLNDSINASIKLLPYVSLSLILAAKKRIENDEKAREEIERKIQLVANCSVPEIKSISASTVKHATHAFICNTGSWVIYLLPIFLVIYLLRQINLVSFNVKKRIQEISYTSKPEQQFSDYIINDFAVM